MHTKTDIFFALILSVMSVNALDNDGSREVPFNIRDGKFRIALNGIGSTQNSLEKNIHKLREFDQSVVDYEVHTEIARGGSIFSPSDKSRFGLKKVLSVALRLLKIIRVI